MSDDQNRTGQETAGQNRRRFLIALAVAAIAVGVPLGVAAARKRWLAQPIFALVGVVQTIPSLALLAFLIALMGCYQGYNSKGGAQGVGAATTSAVVSASILILAFDYVLTEMFFAR